MSKRPLTDELADFCEGGVGILVGTRDANLRPTATRGMGARVHEDRAHVTLFLPAASSERALADLRDNGQIAITFSRPFDHQGVQLKGRVTAIRDATEQDRVLQERYRAAYFEQLIFVGVPRAVSRAWIYWPSVAVDVEVSAMFLQTPGPSAGRAIEEGR